MRSQAYTVTLGPLEQPDLTMSPSHHLLLLTAALGTVSSQDCTAVGYFPHPSDCSQFYRCTDIWSTGQYQQYDFQCAEGTVFDVSIRKVFQLNCDKFDLSYFSVCNWPSQVAGCGAEPEPETTSPPPPPTEVTPPDTTEESSTYRPAPGSPIQCEAPGILSDEMNCNKFWLCKEETEGSGVLEVGKTKSI